MCVSSVLRESGEGSKFISRWVVNLYGVDVLEPDYEMKSGAPGGKRVGGVVVGRRV